MPTKGLLGRLRDLRDRIRCRQYHLWYYNSEVWHRTTYKGVPCLKFVTDCWNYREIIFELKPSLIIEFGTRHGGSAVFFSDILRDLGNGAHLLTVDITHDALVIDPQSLDNAEFMVCSSADPKVAERIRALRQERPGPVFAILDSDHSKDHVLAEMELLRPLLVSGDYMIVEDSNINGHPVLPSFGPGPYEAIVEYSKRYPNDYRLDVAREQRFGFTSAPRGYLQRV